MSHSVEHIRFLVTNLTGVVGHRRFHRHMAEDLQQVILPQVAERSAPSHCEQVDIRNASTSNQRTSCFSTAANMVSDW
jgi:hypothetical protein